MSKHRTDPIHASRIAANKAPGGLWVRVCTRSQLLTEYALTDPAVAGSAADVDGDLAIAAGEMVWVYFYDGDSGVCVGTAISGPTTEANS
jgi:hypothetical protein